MLVYGDRARVEAAREVIARVEDLTRAAAGMVPGIERHAAFVSAFIEASGLAQGIADAEFKTSGCDAPSPAQDAAMRFLVHLARTVRASWESAFERLPFDGGGVADLAAARAPETVRIAEAEGYTFYALYPESYCEAAAALADGRATRILGIRSIGTGLAALVAAATAGPAPVTLRPVGHPFRRTLALAPDLAADLLGDSDARFAVADEGPGLSGSSFGALVDFLEDRGVTPDRIHLFPSHRGEPGPQASARHRERWGRTPRHVVDFDALALRAREPAHRLAHWAADLAGAPEGLVEDVSGGAWRARLYAREADWPPVFAAQERRKFLLRSGGRTSFLKFAGLGRIGERKLDRLRRLARAGFVPPPLGLRHGFLVEEWFGRARPLDPGKTDRDALLDLIGRYLGFRARSFPAGEDDGASLARLAGMARHNAGLALGEYAARPLDALTSAAARLEGRVRRVETDGRLHAWEWLRLPDGRLLKTDAADHCAAHDLVGCQDVAWDVAGASIEFDLDEDEREHLADIVGRVSGRSVDPDLLALLTPCYLAFQVGRSTIAAEAAEASSGEPDDASARDAARLRAAAQAYASRLLAFCRGV